MIKNIRKTTSKQITIRINDEVNCMVMGLSNDHKTYFWDKYGVHVPGYHFAPKYQMGVWDGKIRFFTKTGQTYMYLLEDIIPRIINLGYKIKVSDHRKSVPIFPDLIDENFFSNIIDQKTDNPWVMRDYQVEMVNDLLKEGNGIGVAATGSGKTLMTAALALSYERFAGLKSIIIVPDKNLTAQTFREYAFFGLDVGQYSGDLKDYDHQHVVSTWQSLNNNKTLIQQFDVIIVDECHGVRATILKTLLIQYGKNISHRFGVTGTLPKEKSDVMTVHCALGPKQYEIKASQLIDEGHLANLHINIIQLNVDFNFEYQQYLNDVPKLPILTFKKFKSNYFHDWTSEKNYLQGLDEYTEWIANKIEERRSEEKGNTLCLVNGIKYGEKLAKMIDGAIFLHGKDKMSVRQEAYNLFKERDDVVVIATVQIASVGLDIPRIFNMFYISLGKSFIRTIQSIGRSLRRAHDKDSVNIFDICFDTKFNRKHLNERTKYYRESEYPYSKKVIKMHGRD